MLKPKFHIFRIKIMRAPPGAPPVEIKIIDNGQGRTRAYFQLISDLNRLPIADLSNAPVFGYEEIFHETRKKKK